MLHYSPAAHWRVALQLRCPARSTTPVALQTSTTTICALPFATDPVFGSQSLLAMVFPRFLRRRRLFFFSSGDGLGGARSWRWPSVMVYAEIPKGLFVYFLLGLFMNNFQELFPDISSSFREFRVMHPRFMLMKYDYFKNISIETHYKRNENNEKWVTSHKAPSP